MLLKERLSGWEIERLTAAEVCIDELMATLERHNVGEQTTYRKLADLSDWLDGLLLDVQGPQKRYDTLKGVRNKLDDAFPSPDES